MELTRISFTPKQSTSPCDILIGEGIFPEIRSSLESMIETPSSITIITDSNLKKYAKGLRKDLSKYAKTNIVSFRAGERQKSFQTAVELLSKFAALGVDRKGIVFCLGGGVVGDLGGFVSSIYKRGITYFHVPTSLLAQVDSCIGGKTGIDMDFGKNQVGTFFQPRGVFIDPNFIDSLPKVELVNGIAEMVKSSIIASKRLFERLKRSDFDSIDELKRFIADCCKIKSKIVSADEKEDNLRSILNYGHTVGHALEASSNYSLSHGRSVILGMQAEGWIAKELGIFAKEDFVQQEEMLKKFERNGDSIRPRKKELLKYALMDKKSSSGIIRMSLPEKIGKMHRTKSGNYLVPVSEKLFLGSISRL
jgi:3-dehydroquinate synthase